MLALDANILIRAVLGKRVRGLLAEYQLRVDFVAPDLVFREARKHLPSILQRYHLSEDLALACLDGLTEVIQVIEPVTYGIYESVARSRMVRRDVNDWPVLATALTFGCPIWTEDADFFGCGVATWTCDLVEMYLSEAAAAC